MIHRVIHTFSMIPCRINHWFSQCSSYLMDIVYNVHCTSIHGECNLKKRWKRCILLLCGLYRKHRDHDNLWMSMRSVHKLVYAIAEILLSVVMQ